eukprot:scaffold15215_cov103-Isochrysis_galbana.AAC.6
MLRARAAARFYVEGRPTRRIPCRETPGAGPRSVASAQAAWQSRCEVRWAEPAAGRVGRHGTAKTRSHSLAAAAGEATPRWRR